MFDFGYPNSQESDGRRQRLGARAAVRSRAVRIALFVTCFNDTLLPQTGRAVVEVLERLGHEVVFPEEQTCCGQMHGNTGYHEHGAALAARLERVFADAEVVVSPSASCVTYVREQRPAPRRRL